MAGVSIPYDRSTLRPPMARDTKPVAGQSVNGVQILWAKLSPAASVLGMFGYFLLLGSIAAVVITGQFPWFVVAPLTILLSVAYFDHVEKKEARRSSQGGSRD